MNASTLSNADRLRAIASEARKGARTPGVSYADEDNLNAIALDADKLSTEFRYGRIGEQSVERMCAIWVNELDRIIERNGE